MCRWYEEHFRMCVLTWKWRTCDKLRIFINYSGYKFFYKYHNSRYYIISLFNICTQLSSINIKDCSFFLQLAGEYQVVGLREGENKCWWCCYGGWYHRAGYCSSFWCGLAVTCRGESKRFKARCDVGEILAHIESMMDWEEAMVKELGHDVDYHVINAKCQN